MTKQADSLDALTLAAELGGWTVEVQKTSDGRATFYARREGRIAGALSLEAVQAFLGKRGGFSCTYREIGMFTDRTVDVRFLASALSHLRYTR